jgi:glycosyltransferase involved in cell wall biosynthesis
VRFFAREIWPWLREERPRLIWRLVGKNPEAVRRYTAGDARIECTGPVKDALSQLADARVAVVPLLAGSGTRLKILEAWAAGVAVVSTALGAEGLPARDGANILLADDARSFRAAVRQLLDCSAVCDRLGRAGRATYERYCTWQAAWAALNCAGYL